MAWKRHLARAIFLAALAAIGYAVHLLLPPAPRWTTREPIEILGVTSDGRQFWAVRQKEGYDQGRRSTVELRDLTDGTLVADFLKTEPYLRSYEMSPSGRYVVGHDTHANCLHLIDRNDSSERTIALDPVFAQVFDRNQKSHSGMAYLYRWLASDDRYVVFAPSSSPISQVCLVEMSSGKIRMQVKAGERIDSVSSDGRHAIVWTKISSDYALIDLLHQKDVTANLGEYSSFLRFLPSSEHVLGYKYSDSKEAAIVDLTNWKPHAFPGLRDAQLSPTGHWLIDQVATVFGDPGGPDQLPIIKESRIAILEVTSGKRRGSLQVEGMPDDFCYSQDDGRALTIVESPSESRSAAMIQLPQGNILWNRPVDRSLSTWCIQFSAVGSLFISSEGRLEIWSELTGQTLAELTAPQLPSGRQWVVTPRMNQGRQVVVAAMQKVIRADSWEAWLQEKFPRLFPAANVFVLDLATGRVILNAPLTREDGFAWLSADGRVLLVKDWTGNEHEMRAYDIPVRPRWTWVLGVPGGVGALLIGWRRWRNRAARHAKAGPSVEVSSAESPTQT